MDVTLLTRPVCPPGHAAAAPIPPARTLRIRLNPACISRPDPAAAKKPTRPWSSHDEEPPAKRHIGSAYEKESKNAPTGTKIDGNLLRPCSRGDGAPRSPLGGNNKCGGGGATGGYAGAPATAKRKARTPYSRQASKNRRASPSRVLIAARKQRVRDGASSSSPRPGSSDSGGTVGALLARARPASDAIRRRDIERLRAQARWELEQMVQTVEFHNPFLSPQDVLEEEDS